MLVEQKQSVGGELMGNQETIIEKKRRFTWLIPLATLVTVIVIVAFSLHYFDTTPHETRTVFVNVPAKLDVTNLLSENMTSVIVERNGSEVEELHRPTILYIRGSILSKNMYSPGETLAFVNIRNDRFYYDLPTIIPQERYVGYFGRDLGPASTPVFWIPNNFPDYGVELDPSIPSFT